MKLVDILALDLKVWPDRAESISQGSSGMVFYFPFGGRVHELDGKGISDDWNAAAVTRAEWQAAVDALNAPKVVEWDGLGRPPAGSTCLIRHSGWAAGSWQKADIKYISSEYLIIGHGDFKREQHFHMPDIQFRPILTAEQLAAEEREKAIKEICIDAGSPEMTPGQLKIAEKLYQAGYRKEVAK